jgi:uracil-DNA glycosylase family protein
MSLDQLRRAAADCRNCELYARATQTVFGEGGEDAELMLVGEQPGDKEDLAGHPFVGPAGNVLDRGLEAAGIDRSTVYVTNVVKHFKWTARGKRRLHQRPNAEEITACRPWLDSEIAEVGPRLVVCLGATAAQALLGRAFRVTKQRGSLVDWDLEPSIMATVHPSSILRAQDPESQEAEFSEFVADLKVAADVLRSGRA